MKEKTHHILKEAVLPEGYVNYVFDLYGTLVDIHTEEGKRELWEKLCLFYGYYDAHYTPEELKESYEELVHGKEAVLKKNLEDNPRYAHEASPEIEITEVFRELFTRKGVEPEDSLCVHAGQFFRVMSTEYVKTYQGTVEMLEDLKKKGKKVYLLSNAQRIFTAYEMHVLGIAKYFDGILISSDYQTKKPDIRFFDVLKEKYSLKEEETLFIGNDSRTDIGGAIGAGFDTYYVRSNISPENDMAENADYIVPEFDFWCVDQNS
ncbi:MAG: HAD family hydrolase [Agathobacter sp.]|nr:HAD family hydrolase [Agathobacter sp.]MBQ2282764.1 HAD family hydrolase [Agathobacter sp.]